MELLPELTRAVREVRGNLLDLVEEWREFQSELERDDGGKTAAVPAGQLVAVKRADLERMVTEAMMLKEFLPKVLSPEYLSSVSRLTRTEQELCAVVREKNRMAKEEEHMKRRMENVMTDLEQEKQDKFTLKSELSSLNGQASQQFDYWSQMGVTCCSMLWRLSQNEESVSTILSGSKAGDFLLLVTTTLRSYFSGVSQEHDLPAEDSQESQYILALCGTLTNITASAYGRNFVASSASGLELIDTLCSSLTAAPIGPKCTKLKGLIIMALYNVSINQAGLQVLVSKPELMRVLVWLLQEEPCPSNQLHIIRLLQSMVLEPESLALVQRVVEAIPLPLLQHLVSSGPSPEIREAANELRTDLQQLQHEQ